MIIEPYQKYRIVSLGIDNLKYEWNIHTVPEKRAWKQVGADISIGTLLNNGEYKVLLIEKTSKQEVIFKVVGHEKRMQSTDLSTSRCTTCFGKLEIDCRMCGGSGFDCRRCNGTGKTYCIACRGGQGEVEGFNNSNFPVY